MTIKILHLGKYYPPNFGGIETVCKQIVETKSLKFFKTIIFFNKTDFVEDNQGFKKIAVKESLKFFSQPLSVKYVKAVFKEIQNNDIVHVHCPNILAYFSIVFFSLVSKKKKPKIIMHWHSDIVTQKKIYFLIKPFEKYLLNLATKIITSSKTYTQSSIPLKKFSRKILTINYGYKIQNKNPSTKFKKSIKKLINKRKVILTVGRNTSYKGFKYLVQAQSKIMHNALIIIVGSNTKDLVGSNNIVTFENLTPDETNYLYSISDIFCLPSISKAEAFGIVLIEAMANKLPLITTKITGSGVNEVNINNKTGLVINSKDSDELAHAINYLILNDDIRNLYSKNSYERYLKRFQSKFFLKKIEKIYSQVLKN